MNESGEHGTWSLWYRSRTLCDRFKRVGENMVVTVESWDEISLGGNRQTSWPWI